MDKDIVLLRGARTPFGRFGGGLRQQRPTELSVVASLTALERSEVLASQVDNVVVGNVMQTTTDCTALARNVGLRVGAPIETPALTVNRNCGSGLQAVLSAADSIRLDQSDVALAGGVEVMSQAPHVARGLRWGVKGAVNLEDTLVESTSDDYNGWSMGATAENLAIKYGITREECDQFALTSHQRAAVALANGRLHEEVTPVSTGHATVDTDEHVRPDTSLESLSRLPPAFREGGVSTAGNSSGINDGAAAVVVTAADVARRNGWQPSLRLVASAVVGVDPAIMGIGPVPALRLASKRAGIALDEIELFEINEAFAAQYLAVERELELDRDTVNPNGGAIAFGHPVGASGARLVLTLMHEMEARGLRYGATALCIGAGQGIAAIWERYA